MNELAHIDEFHEILSEYSLSANAVETLKQTKLVLLTAATATGRNTIINELLRTGEYHYIISDTTRKPRANNHILEQNGREYWFRSELEVLDDLKAGDFLEAEVIHGQQVSGISIRELQTANASNKIAITDVDIGGIRNIMRLKPDAVPILVLPPSFDEWQRRIIGRGDMPSAEYKRRLETAARIFTSGLAIQNFNIVVNDAVQQAAIAVHQLATLQSARSDEQQRGRQLAEQLSVETAMLLETL
jgi:guanylate kinase